MPSLPRPSRRALTLFLACLTLSFILQLPLAWLLIRLDSYLPFRSSNELQLLAPENLDTDTETLSINLWSAAGYHCVILWAQPPATISRRYLEHHTVAPRSPNINALVSPWQPQDLHPALIDSAAWPTRTGVYSRPNMTVVKMLTSHHAAGWPFLAVEGAATYDSNNGIQTSGIITAPPFTPIGGDLHYAIYHPRWPAYLANTAIHATALTALLLTLAFTFKSLRARHRQKRNRCPTCNYDLRATPTNQPCPECGHLSPRTPSI